MAKMMVSMSPTRANGQTAMKIGDNTFTADPQEVDTGDVDDELKQAVKDGKLVVTGLDPAEQERLFGTGDTSGTSARQTQETAPQRAGGTTSSSGGTTSPR